MTMATLLERLVKLKTGMEVPDRFDWHEARRSTIPEIAADFGCSMASVYRLMKAYRRVPHTTVKSCDQELTASR